MFWADLLPVCLPALSRGNFSDFRGSEKENALSQRSGGVRNSSWALFCTKFYLEVRRKWNKTRSGMIDSIFEWLTIFFLIWKITRHIIGTHLKKCSAMDSKVKITFRKRDSDTSAHLAISYTHAFIFLRQKVDPDKSYAWSNFWPDRLFA